MNLLHSLGREAGLFIRSRSSVAALALLCLLASIAIGLGNAEVQRQEASIERVRALDITEREAALAGAPDYGDAAYAAFHLTWNPPSEMAFTAMGQRDIAPWMLRVRALALEGQIHETDSFNPELSLTGRFDYAFVMAFLLPLFAIVVMYDMVSSEREAGRIPLLVASAGDVRRLWWLRTAVRVLGLLLACLLPLWLGGLSIGTTAGALLTASAIVLVTVLVWTVVILVFSFRPWTSAVIATSLTGVWLAVALILPLGGKVLIDYLEPGTDGAQIALLQRETVNGAWDLPKEATLTPFFASHPEWADTAPITQPFHWKWYYAFQQVGDETAAGLSRDYRAAIARRDALTGWVALISPPVAVQRALQSLAGTDVEASLAYEQRIRDFHAQLRRYYYPFLFNEEPYRLEALRDLPQFSAN
jgi:ABC-2 type transport system permease protein